MLLYEVTLQALIKRQEMQVWKFLQEFKSSLGINAL